MDLSEKLISIAENEQKAADANAQLEQILYGSDTGGKSYYDFFWDTYQQNGERTNYSMAFSYFWYDAFKPKYDIKPTNASYMFYGNTITGLDLREDKFKEKYGVEIDLTDIGNLNQFISYSRTKYVGTINAKRAASGLTSAFSNATNLLGINKIVMSDIDETPITINNTAFQNCSALQDISFEGVIAQTINFQWSPLTVASMKNIIEHLADYSGTDNEFKYKVTFSSDCITALEAEGNTSPNGNSWLEYIEDLGWLRG